MTTQKQYIKWAEEEIKRLEQDVKGERAKSKDEIDRLGAQLDILKEVNEQLTQKLRVDEKAKWINGFRKWAKEQKNISNKDVEDCLKVIEND